MTRSSSPPPDVAQSKFVVILAQVFISCMMALLMVFVMAILPMGFRPGWVGIWAAMWLKAWPVAFVLSLVVGPLAFRLSGLTLRASRRLRGRA